MEYIKNQIIISNDLKQIIKDINIDWKYCDLFGRKNILKEVCTYWESGNYDISKISNGFSGI